MRILIATDSYYPQVNGASIFGQRLANRLTDRGHQVLVVAPGTSLKSGYCVVAGVEVFGVSSVPVFFYRGMRVALPTDLERTARHVLREFRPDVVHAQGHFPTSKAIIRDALKTGIPVVGTNHFMPENLSHYAHLPARLDRPLRRWMWNQFRDVYETVSFVTTPTAQAAAYMRSNGFARDIHVVSNGIDLRRFHPGVRGTDLSEKYGLPDVPLLLYVGRLDREKNLDFVLRALSRIQNEISIHFAMAGTGARRQGLERLASKLGVADRTSFLGFVPDDDLPGLYAMAYCFVMAGTAELQSIATMEAMASGLPVLAADAVALPELVRPGRNGCLFEPGNVDMLSDQIYSLFSDPVLRDRMGSESLRMIRDHAVERTVEKFEGFYGTAVETATVWTCQPARIKRLVPSFLR